MTLQKTMFSFTRRSIFRPDKRDEALERLTIGITQAAKNCAVVIDNLNTICQDPESYDGASNLIDKWAKSLFTNYFHEFPEHQPLLSQISHVGKRELENEFFNYLASLTPFFYERKTITSTMAFRTEKYKWTADDFNQLKIKILQKWFYGEWDNWDTDTRLKFAYEIESNVQRILESIAISSNAKASIWNSEKKIEAIIYSDRLNRMTRKIKPEYPHQYQADLFEKYTGDFIKVLPSAFEAFDNNFYQAGTYLGKYFQWS